MQRKSNHPVFERPEKKTYVLRASFKFFGESILYRMNIKKSNRHELLAILKPEKSLLLRELIMMAWTNVYPCSIAEMEKNTARLLVLSSEVLEETEAMYRQ